LTITTSRPHALPSRTVEISAYLELFPQLETLTIDWTYCLAGTNAALEYEEVTPSNVSSTSLRHLAIHLKPYLIFDAADGRPVAHPVSQFRTSLEMRDILQHLVLPNLESLRIHIVWNPNLEDSLVHRGIAELANCIQCFRRFAALVDVGFSIENKRESSTLVGSGYLVRASSP
jgi:hypothetical protein